MTMVQTFEIDGDTVTLIGEKGETIYKRKTGKAPDSSLFEAAVAGNLEAVKQHIAAGTDLNQVDPNPLGSKGSSLQAAAAFGYTEVAVALIEAGADVNQKEKEGQTPLHTAALFCYPKIAQALLDNGADKTIKDNDGQTALGRQRHRGRRGKDQAATGQVHRARGRVPAGHRPDPPGHDAVGG